MDTRLVGVMNLTRALRSFSAERDWDPFHAPKNPAMAFSVERAELHELFTWLTPGQPEALASAPDRVTRALEEVADILIYLVRFADVLAVDPGAWSREVWELCGTRL